MLSVLRQPGMRYVFIANLVSMIGSGLNSAGVTWYILQATGSEMALGTLVVLQAIPALLLMPFSGVIIDREDRRRLVMILDAGRGLVILTVAILALNGRVQTWHLYVMSVLVTAGFWMFWPTISALLQELTTEDQHVAANSFLLAGIQGGWLLAGAFVGFIYNHIGLGGVLLLDAFTYVISFNCYLFVRKGRVVVAQPASAVQHESAVAKFKHETREGLRYIHHRPFVLLLGVAWALFIAAMLTQNVIGAPLSDRILHAGAVGFGWINGGWAIGAFLAALLSPRLIAMLAPRRSVYLSLGVLAVCVALLPFSRFLAVAVAIYFVMGTARGLCGVAISSTMMSIVPKHMMGRVQNTFYMMGTMLQLVFGYITGWVAHYKSLTAGFAIVASTYAFATLAAGWPISRDEIAREASSGEDVPVAARE